MPNRVTTAQGMPVIAIGCSKSISPMTQASAICGADAPDLMGWAKSG